MFRVKCKSIRLTARIDSRAQQVALFVVLFLVQFKESNIW